LHVVVVRRQLPPPLPCAATSDKAEYVNGMIAEPVRRTSSLDCLNNPSSSSSSSSSAAAAAAAVAGGSSDCASTSLTDAGQSPSPYQLVIVNKEFVKRFLRFDLDCDLD